MRALPFPDATFDVVVSSLAIHNIRSNAARAKAIAEAWRVLKAGGRLAIADIRATSRYAARSTRSARPASRAAAWVALLVWQSVRGDEAGDGYETTLPTRSATSIARRHLRRPIAQTCMTA